MKIRQGFVSNSSSSSYTCNVCGWSEVSWERPYGFTNCMRGHGLCEDCYEIDEETLKKLSSLSVDEILKELGISREWSPDVVADLEKSRDLDLIKELATEDELCCMFCPVCSFEVIIESDMKRYLEKISNIKPEAVFQTIKAINKRRKKLYNHEYISYVCGEMGINTVECAEEIKNRFKDYDEFMEFVR
jgi:hypothetical protein